MTNHEGFNHDAYWNRIGKPTIGKKKSAEIRCPLLHILYKMLVGAFVHRTESRDNVQKPDLWLLSFLDEGHNANVAWILATYLSSESWDDKMFRKAFDRRTKKLSTITTLEAPPQAWNLLRNEPSGLDSTWGDWNAMLILYYLADEAGYTIPTAFDPPNLPPYPYPYVPYHYPHIHYPDMGNLSYGGGGYGAPRDAYLFTGATPSYQGNSIVQSSGYEISGSSK
ncbi:hypothetical protein Tco_1194111 [Tanacetum coccineum]